MLFSDVFVSFKESIFYSCIFLKGFERSSDVVRLGSPPDIAVIPRALCVQQGARTVTVTERRLPMP